MKIAFIHDWLDKYGGAERVVTAIAEKIEFDFYYAYVNKMDPATLRCTFAGRDVTVVESAFLRRFKPVFRKLMPLFPMAVRLFNRQTADNKVDVVISSSWALSKGYRIGDEIHISYFQARNFKYVWDEAHLYFRGPARILSFLKKPLQQFDLETASNPQHIIANSEFVRSWIRDRYGRESHVIYPPVDVEHFSLSTGKEPYYVTVGRLEPYKRFDLIVDAFNENRKDLVIIGDGSQLRSLKNKARENIRFTGFLQRTEINQYLSRARGFVYAGVEDFGIVLVEALASGTPVIAYSGGAAGEIIRAQDDNGLLYHEQTAASLKDAIDRFEGTSFDAAKVQASSGRFSRERFQAEFLSFLGKVLGTPLICLLLLTLSLLSPGKGKAAGDTVDPRRYDTTRFIWGANGHPLSQVAYWNNIDSQISVLRTMGFSWYRVDVIHNGQGKLAPESDVRWNELLRKAGEAGITLLPVLTPALTSDMYDGRSAGAIYDQCYQLARGFALQYGSHLPVYELGNENDIGVLKEGSGNDSAQYDTAKIKLLGAFFRGMEDGIRSVEPAAKVMINNSGWFHLAYFDLLIREGVRIDMIGYHWYADVDNLKTVLDLLRTRFGDKPVWFTEVNRASSDGHRYKAQTRKIGRYLRAIQNRGTNVRAFFIYELFDEPEFPRSEGRYGLIAWTNRYSDFVYKPFALAFRTLMASFSSTLDR